MKNKATHLYLELNPCEKASFPTKKGTSFAKKFIPHAGKDSRPIKMLNQDVEKEDPSRASRQGKYIGGATQALTYSILHVVAGKKHEAEASVSVS
ncbi:hypothetical protein Gohar_007069 [Gossypium harknessii]|uniref:Uncharacterized protein n=1 Tax=Gossypium harknessii TaxID=34285 RepID=A0A7J9GFF9_9ROSI|nr:hypothetical protein [Gossypium harknessii]